MYSSVRSSGNKVSHQRVGKQQHHPRRKRPYDLLSGDGRTASSCPDRKCSMRCVHAVCRLTAQIMGNRQVSGSSSLRPPSCPRHTVEDDYGAGYENAYSSEVFPDTVSPPMGANLRTLSISNGLPGVQFTPCWHARPRAAFRPSVNVAPRSTLPLTAFITNVSDDPRPTGDLARVRPKQRSRRAAAKVTTAQVLHFSHFVCNALRQEVWRPHCCKAGVFAEDQ